MTLVGDGDEMGGTGDAGVAVTPGIDFGDNAEGFIRFSYTNSLENIHRGLDRIERYLKECYSGACPTGVGNTGVP